MNLEIDPKKLMFLLPELSHQQLQELSAQPAALITQLQTQVVAIDSIHAEHSTQNRCKYP